MNEPTLEKISAELSDRLIGQKFGKIFALSKTQIAIDFRLKSGEYLFISVQPNSPRIYLIKRKLKQLEKISRAQLPFVSILRKRIANSLVTAIEKFPNERVLRFTLRGKDELGRERVYMLVSQLTGRSSNLLLLDENELVLDSLRNSKTEEAVSPQKYSPPEKPESERQDKWEPFPQGGFESLSEALDQHYLQKESKELFESKANAARGSVSKKLKKRFRLKKKLARDLENHGKAEKWKHLGDVLLANVSTAERKDDKIIVIDYFEEATPKIEIETNEDIPITELAEQFFKRYEKARNAKKEITKRLRVLSGEIEKLEAEKERLEAAVTSKDLETIESYIEEKRLPKQKTGKKKRVNLNAARRFVSSDDIEILVGKRSKDNDYLTFRIAKSLDTWLHAADYPGSHVVIRNPRRQEIPQTTLLEAAQLAAFYSKARKEAKAAVHYTQKKFVNKPKGGAPGLVSLASFKTILVEPKIPENVKKK